MKGKRFTEEQIIRVLKEAGGGAKVPDLLSLTEEMIR
jgi:hypothetical protein